MNAGDTASVQCSISKGDLPLRFLWYHNTNLVEERLGILTGYLGKRVSSLSIDSVNAEHSGAYTCSVTNPAGAVNFTAYLNVNGSTPS